MCHGVDGKGRIGANLNDFPGIQVDETLVVTIRTGIAGSPMPAWGEANGGPFSEADIADVAAYIEAAFLGTEPIQPLPEYIPPDIPALPDIDGDPSAGAVVYQAECRACHGEGGRGGIGSVLAKSWTGIDPYVYIRNVVGEGIRGSTMPAWLQANGGPLSDQQVANVSAYVLSLDPAIQTESESITQEGPLNLTVSLVMIGVLGVFLIIGLIVYYRRA
jgi:mono/diheme cytochrome c family protein